MDGLLQGKVAVITGAARGIGQRTAELFAEQGAEVHAWDVRPEVKDTASGITRSGGRAAAHIVDTTDRALTAETAQEILREAGRVDVLVNCAGIGLASPFLEMEPDLWDRILAVNLTGTANCCWAVLPSMVDQQWGRIINISSVTGPRTIIPELSVYAASKGAVSALTKALAVEMAPHNITVNAILPGTVETPLLREFFEAAGANAEETFAEMAKAVPMGRLGRPEDIAGACLMLASEYASYITGTEIVVDGAYTLPEWG
jgi:NAD(P)-dependent dehydrogenase (short-subunit alcohol dehydrogenase family)